MSRRVPAIGAAVRPVVEHLEVRRLLSTVTLTASGGGNQFSAWLNSSATDVDFYVNGPPGVDTPYTSVPLSQLQTIKIVDTDASYDTLTVNVPGATWTLDASSAGGLSVEASKGVLNASQSLTLGSLHISDGAVIHAIADISVSDYYGVAVAVEGRLDLNGGTLSAAVLQVQPGGVVAANGGSISSNSYYPLSIYNYGTFELNTANALQGAAGTFQNDGLVVVNNHSLSTANALSMNFYASLGTFDLVSGNLTLPNLAGDRILTIEGTNGVLTLPSDEQVASLQITGGKLAASVLTVTGGSVVQHGGSVTASGVSIRSGTWTQTGGSNAFGLMLGMRGSS